VPLVAAVRGQSAVVKGLHRLSHCRYAETAQSLYRLNHPVFLGGTRNALCDLRECVGPLFNTGWFSLYGGLRMFQRIRNVKAMAVLHDCGLSGGTAATTARRGIASVQTWIHGYIAKILSKMPIANYFVPEMA